MEGLITIDRLKELAKDKSVQFMDTDEESDNDEEEKILITESGLPKILPQIHILFIRLWKI